MRQLFAGAAWALSFVTVRYIIAGGTSFLVNFATFYACHRFLGLWYVYATIVAGTVAWVVNFPLHKLWTFGDFRRGATKVQAPAHFALKLLNTYCSDPFLLYACVEWIELSPEAGKFVVGGLLGLQNYVVCRYLIFRRPV